MDKLEKKGSIKKHEEMHILITSEQYKALNEEQQTEAVISFLRSGHGYQLIRDYFSARENLHKTIHEIFHNLGIDSNSNKRNTDIHAFLRSTYTNVQCYRHKTHHSTHPKFTAEELLGYNLYKGKLEKKGDMDALEKQIEELNNI